MKSAFVKDILRSIKGSWGRFFAILIIVALGAGFYAGLRMTAPDMRLSADAYYDGTNLYDIRVISSLGLSRDLVDDLADVEGVEQVMPAYETDILGVIEGTQYTLRVHSLDTEAAAASDTADGTNALSDDESYLNRPILISGEWPSNTDECVLSAETITHTTLSLGDTIEIKEGLLDPSEVFETRTLTIVGFVRSSYYSSSASLGITSIGSGTIEQYVFVPKSSFKESYPFTNAFITVEGARELDATGEDYQSHVAEVQKRIEELIPHLKEARLEELISDAQEELDQKRTEYEQEKAAALAELDATAADLDTLRQQVDAGYTALEPTYQAGLAEYEAARSEADTRFAEAETEFANSQTEIDEVEAPEIYVLDRSKNYGAKSFDSDAGRVDQIARVFPLLFFLVAALVSLTTMTRMVEEERLLIGTYKALGYSRQHIASKYVLYAFIASLIGAVIGIASLTQVLPAIIMNAYAIMYDIPIGATPVDAGIGLLSAALGIGITCFAAWAAALSTLREKAASLMLPRAPAPGRRIFLERFGPVWKRLSFSWKVTCRNIFRYKKRLAMTLIGIAGCTALLLTGFGLNNAVDDIIPKQFDEIYRYNLTVTLSEDINDNEAATVEELFGDDTLVEASTRAHTETVSLFGAEESSLAAQLIAPEDPGEFGEFRTIRERETQKTLTIEPNTVILSEKLAHSLGVQVGGTLELARQDAAGYATEERYELTVGGIMENYVSHYLLIDPRLYAEVIGEDPVFATIFAEATTDSDKRERLTDTLLGLEGVRTVGFNDDMIESYKTALSSVDSIVVVLIVAAAALAFVVLYNLTNINITERQREIATLKVLGFSRREMSSYIFREMIILTILGALLGLVLGVFMESYVVTTAEVDAVMFGREIHALSFVIAFAMTVLFSFAIAFFMRGKLTHINMVESLKSNE